MKKEQHRPHSLKPSGEETGAALDPQRGTQKQVIRRQNGENSSRRQWPNRATRSRSSLRSSGSTWRLGAQARVQGVGPQGEHRDWMLWRGAYTHSCRCPRKSLGLSERPEAAAAGPLTPRAGRPPETTFLNAAGGMRGISELRSPQAEACPATTEAGRAWEVPLDTTAEGGSRLAAAKARASAWGRGPKGPRPTQHQGQRLPPGSDPAALLPAPSWEPLRLALLRVSDRS